MGWMVVQKGDKSKRTEESYEDKDKSGTLVEQMPAGCYFMSDICSRATTKYRAEHLC